MVYVPTVAMKTIAAESVQMLSRTELVLEEAHFSKFDEISKRLCEEHDMKHLIYFKTIILICKLFTRVEIFQLREKLFRLRFEPGTFGLKLPILYQLSYSGQIERTHSLITDTVRILQTVRCDYLTIRTIF